MKTFALINILFQLIVVSILDYNIETKILFALLNLIAMIGICTSEIIKAVKDLNIDNTK